MLATVILSRALLGSSERLSPGELACGLLTLCGIVLVAQGLTQPSAAGDAAAGDAAVSVAGVAVAAVAGVLATRTLQPYVLTTLTLLFSTYSTRSTDPTY